MGSYAEKFEQYRRFLNRAVRYDLQMFEVSKISRIVDIGCGFGDSIRRLNRLGYISVSGVEPDPYCVEKRGDLDIRVGSITNTGYPSNSVDVVIVENVFHHVAEYGPALLEIKRILKPKQILCFIEPRNSFWRKCLDSLTFQTPLPDLVGGGLKLRKLVMGEELETGLYPQWLKNHDLFFDLMEQHFQIVWLRKNAFFYFCKAQKYD